MLEMNVGTSNHRLIYKYFKKISRYLHYSFKECSFLISYNILIIIRKYDSLTNIICMGHWEGWNLWRYFKRNFNF